MAAEYDMLYSMPVSIIVLANIIDTVLHSVIKGLEGFAVTMQDGACETESQIPRPIGRLHGEYKHRKTGLNHDYYVTFAISPREC